MDRERWLRIARAARDKGLDDGVRGTREATLDVLVADLHNEQAASLDRVGRRLRDSIALMEVHAARFAAHGSEASRRSFALAREDASQARWEMVVQREAMGLTDHSVVDRAYPIPQKLV